ncbi:MAG TPA: hypothetical protein VKE27_06050 [Candidatus Dormibacteraeota bacterium]|nr:hypothetical protein [Candidatus Dormibacteraeota bacterium]
MSRKHRQVRRPAPQRNKLLIGAGVVVAAVLAGIAVWVNSQPPKPDENALHADIAAGRSGAEETFVGTVVSAPASAGDHEQIEVSDTLGDRLELDYNTQLGEWIPVRVGDRLTIHGQLYIDPGRVGIHCLHAQTSSGCPDPGWIQLASKNYA